MGAFISSNNIVSSSNYKLSQITKFDRDTLNRIILYLQSQKIIKKIVFKKHEELMCYKKAQSIIDDSVQFKIPISLKK